MRPSLDMSLKVLAIKYWQRQLNGFDPCYFPALSDGLNLRKQQLQHHCTEIDIGSSDAAIYEFCAANGVTLSDLFQTVWAIVIRSYVNTEEGCFEYVVFDQNGSSGSSFGAPVGMFTSIASFKIQNSTSLRNVMEEMQANSVASLGHQAASMDEIHHSLGLSGQRLFNTRLSFCETTEPSLDVQVESMNGDQKDKVMFSSSLKASS